MSLSEPHLTPDGITQLAARIGEQCAEDLAITLYRNEGFRNDTNPEFIGHVRWEVAKAVDDVLIELMLDAGIHLHGDQWTVVVDSVTKTTLEAYQSVKERELDSPTTSAPYSSGPGGRFVDDDFPF